MTIFGGGGSGCNRSPTVDGKVERFKSSRIQRFKRKGYAAATASSASRFPAVPKVQSPKTKAPPWAGCRTSCLQSPVPRFRGIGAGFYSRPLLPVRGKAFSLSTTADRDVIASPPKPLDVNGGRRRAWRSRSANFGAHRLLPATGGVRQLQTSTPDRLGWRGHPAWSANVCSTRRAKNPFRPHNQRVTARLSHCQKGTTVGI